jgi:hypothetical protein
MQLDLVVELTPISCMIDRLIHLMRRKLNRLSEFADSGQPEVRNGHAQWPATAAC